MSKIETEATVLTIEETLKTLPTRYGKPRAKVGAMQDFAGNPYPGQGTKGYTSKDKAVLGISEEDTCIWSGIPLDFATSSMMKAIGKKIEIAPEVLCANIVLDFINRNYDALDEMAGEYVKTQDSEDDIQKKISDAQNRIKRLQEQLARIGNK